ncbi:TPA: hypothetical protein ACGCGJ_000437 [Stenotrophomonas maltophilia]
MTTDNKTLAASRANESTPQSDADLIASLQSMRDRMIPVLTQEFGDAFDGDFDTMLEAANALKRLTAHARQGHVLVNAKHLERVLVCADANHSDDCMADEKTTVTQAIEKMREALKVPMNLRDVHTPPSGRKLPSRFQLGDSVIADRRKGRVVGVTFALVDFHDGLGEGAKLYYTVEQRGGSRIELTSDSVSPALIVACPPYAKGELA